ncbi:hypothetical protein AX15_004351 [Amanita polypyramis BW_CC]|nr:hypothetical protein AX15_004351 [Amanita polypyramis BW_CC]
MATTNSPNVTLDELKGQIEKARQLLNPMMNTFDGIQKEIAHGGTLHPDVQKLYEEMDKQENVNSRWMNEIQILEDHFRSSGVYEGLEDLVRKEMGKEIDAIVEEQVAKALGKLISKEQQDAISDINRALEQTKIKLDNSESRRANAALENGGSNSLLNMIKMTDGNVSIHFPKTLQDLSSLDEETVRELMVDYKLSSPDDPIPLSLNKFTLFCGLSHDTPVLLTLITNRYFAMEGHVNTFGGSPLNRLSWLRQSHAFLNAIIVLPTTRWLLFNGGKPLAVPDLSKTTKQAITFLTTDDVKSLLGSVPYFGHGKERGEITPEPTDPSARSPLGAARLHAEPVVFLGVLEREAVSALLLQDVLKDPTSAVSKLGGAAYFSMDVSNLDLSPEELDQFLRGTEPGRQGIELTWTEPRGLSLELDMETAGIFALARTITNWNSASKYCPACGSKTYSMWGGWKVSCGSLLPWADNTGRKPCLSSKGVHNFCHPRTDAVVIMVVIDETGDRILLGRGKRFSGRFYSALAGFIEPGETFEDAVKREMWEEAGIDVWDVRYHSGQPWPYPANLMAGFYARADSRQPIRVDLDNELVDARWFAREEVLDILQGKSGALLSQADYRRASDNHEGKESLDATSRGTAPADPSPGGSGTGAAVAGRDLIKLPPTTAIAGVLIRHWAEGKFDLKKDSSASRPFWGYL